MESRSHLGLTWSPIQRVPETPSPGIKRLGRKAGHSPPPSAEVCLHDRHKYTFHIFLHQPPSSTETTARGPSDPPTHYLSPPYCVFPLFLPSLLANLFTAILSMLLTHENRFALEIVGAGASKAFRCCFFPLCSVWLELCTILPLGFYTMKAGQMATSEE
jgi:hypothetical protein